MIILTAKISLLVYLGIGFVLYIWQRSFLYFPVAEKHYDDLDYEYLDSGGESIKVAVTAPDKEHAVIYFGGNAEDVNNVAEDFRAVLPSLTTYLVNYRGYGGSSGSPTQENLFADALRIYDAVQQRHSQISIMGRSLGSGIATYLASERATYRLILVTPYDSILAIAKRRYPIYPISILLRDRYESVNYVSGIRARTLILIADYDRLVPREHSIRLAEAFPDELIEQLVLENTGHNTLSGHSQYWQKIRRFLDD